MSPSGNMMDELETYDQTLLLDIFEEELTSPLDEEPECMQLPIHQDELLKKESSSLNNYNVSDQVALKGRSYKVGWGRNLSFLCLGSKSCDPDNEEIETEVKNDFVPLPLRFVTFNRITNLNHSVFRNCLEDHLKCQFNSSKVEIVNEMPYFTTVPGFKLLQDHQKVSIKSAYEQEIWNLCVTLWNEISPEELLKFDKRTIRKRLFSSWLKSATNDSVTLELDGDQNNTFYKILTYISGHHIREASQLALKSHNYNLSLLISQLPSNTSMRSCLVKQVIQWNECDMFKYVDSNLWKIYSLLAGEPYVDYGESSMCAYEGMDWLRTLGMYFWYIIEPGETVSFAVNLYESIFEEHFHTIKPIPDYENPPKNVYDLRFELLKFYSDNSYSLTRVLNPATHTKDALDNRFSWLLLQTLTSLSYGDISKQAKTYVHTQFGAQLEQMGLWHWAIFVLLFIEDLNVRKVCVKDMLGRHVQLFSEKWDDYPAREKMIVKDFKIPEVWINSAKADLAVLQKNYKEAIFYLCYSNRWSEAHKLVMEHLVPDHFLYYEYDLLINILTPLWENQEYLPDWEERGGLMYDFAKLAVQYNEMLTMSEPDIIRDELVVFRAALMSICNRFQLFNPETYMHDVCLAEMSARVMMMLRKLLFAIEGITEDVCTNIARNAQRLPMTGDYLQQELNEILVDFISLYQQRTGP